MRIYWNPRILLEPVIENLLKIEWALRMQNYILFAHDKWKNAWAQSTRLKLHAQGIEKKIDRARCARAHNFLYPWLEYINKFSKQGWIIAVNEWTGANFREIFDI